MELLTLKTRGRGEFTEKRSRFIGTGCHVTTADEAMAFVDEIRREFPDATHNVFAYVLRSGAYRFSDDGEPGGTGGVPCCEALQKSGLTDCCVVATRYFGGILLGAGGLVRAYSKTARVAVEACGVVRMVLCDLIDATVGYDAYQGVVMLAETIGAVVVGQDFTDRVSLRLRAVQADSAALIAGITNLTAGKANIEVVGTEFAPQDA